MKFIRKNLDSESKILIKNSKWVFIANIIGAGFGLIRSIAVARGLGVEIFGTYMIVVSLVALLQELLNLNIGTALIKFGADYQAGNRIDKLVVLIKRSLRISAAMAGVLILVVLLLTFTSYDYFIKKPGLHWFVIGYTVANSLNYFNLITRSVLRLFYKFKKNSIIQILMDIIETALVVAAVYLYPGNLAVFFAAAISTRFLNTFVCSFLGFYEVKKDLWPFRKEPDHLIDAEIPVIRSFVIHNSLSNTLKSLIQQGDVLLLGALAGAASVGLYSAAKKLAYSILTLTDPLVSSIFPQLSKLVAAKKIPELKKMLGRITLFGAGPVLVTLAGGFLLNTWAIEFVYGAEYLPASMPFFILLVNAIIGTLTFWVLPLVQSLGLVNIRLKVYAAMLVPGILAALVLVPAMQASGMAIALTFMNLSINLLFIYAVFKKMNFLVRPL